MNRAAALAAGLWMAMHLGHAVLFFDRHPAPALDVIALVLCFGATCWACSPLVTGRVELSSVEAASLAAAGAASFVMVAPLLSAADLNTFACWALGAVSPLIAALAMRRQPRWAAALALMICVVAIVSARRDGLEVSAYFLMFYPPLFWLGSALLVRRVFDSSEAVRTSYDQVADQEARRAELTKVREQVAASRRAELRHDVLPMLEQLAAGAALSIPYRSACGELAARLRDDLRARTILTADLRAMLHDARRAGTRVVVLDDRDHPADDDIAQQARHLIQSSLAELRGADLTYRISADGTAITLVAQGTPDTIVSAAKRLHLVRNLSLQVDDDLLYAQMV